jgi:hypothetical protein
MAIEASVSAQAGRNKKPLYAMLGKHMLRIPSRKMDIATLDSKWNG